MLTFRPFLTLFSLLLASLSSFAAPAHFRANRGQWDLSTHFSLQAGAMQVNLGTDRVLWTHQATDNPGQYFTRFVDVRPDLIPKGESPSSAQIRYLSADKPAIHTQDFAAVRYPESWPGIDILYHLPNQQLKYDFEVEAGADPCQIRLALEGVEQLKVLADGQLEIRTAHGTFHEAAPYAYQLVDGREIPVPSAYQINPKGELQFSFPDGFDRQRDLVIDPVAIEWSTYVTNSAGGAGYMGDFELDGQGNIIGVGSSFGAFPVTPGAFDTTYGGQTDAVVYKLDASGSNLLWATYLGGNRRDEAFGIAQDQAGNIYVTGRTNSTDFPVTPGVFQPQHGDSIFGNIDVFVSKLSPDGSSLIYSTFYGGLGDDVAGDIDVNATGDAFVGGFTNDGDNPITPGAYDETFNGAPGFSDIFVFRLNADASTLLYATFLGGTQSETVEEIIVNERGEASITGEVNSPDFPTSPNALYALKTGTGACAYAARLSADGSQLQASTYFCGNQADHGEGMALNAAGDFYLTGRTYSNLLPLTANAYDSVHGGDIDAFVARISADATQLQYASFVGDSGAEIGTGIAVNELGEVFLTGITRSRDFVATPCALDSSFAGASGGYWAGDVFLRKFDATGRRLLYSTLIGGSDNEITPEIILDDAACTKSVVIGTTTMSTDYPITPNALQGQILGTNQVHAFTRLTEDLDVDILLPADSCPVAGDSFALDIAVAGCGHWTDFRQLEWSFGDGQTVLDSAPRHAYASNGSYTLALRRPGCPEVLDTRTLNLFGVDLGPDLQVCQGQSLTLDASTPQAVSYRWYDGVMTPTHRVDKSGDIYVEVTAANGCTASDTVNVMLVGPDDVQVPNVFTPNFDGVNDLFFVTGLGDMPWQLEVYDRWGRLVYSSPAYQNDWQGGNLPEGVYYYVLTSTINCGNFFGQVTILR